MKTCLFLGAINVALAILNAALGTYVVALFNAAVAGFAIGVGFMLRD